MCNGKVTGDSTQEQLELARKKVYGTNHDYCKTDESAKPVSDSVRFNEFDILETAGVWAQYDSLKSKEQEVTQLKDKKRSNDLRLFKRHAVSLEACSLEGITTAESQKLYQELEDLTGPYGEMKWLRQNFWVACVDFAASIQFFFHLLTTILGTQTTVRNMPQKERTDAKGCYDCFYWFELLSITCWLTASLGIQATMFSMVRDFNAEVDLAMESSPAQAFDSARSSTCPLSSQLDAIFESFPGRFELEKYLLLQLICYPICLVLWFTMFCSNARLVKEQLALIDRHHPIDGARPNQVVGDAVVAAPPPEEPPKPKPAAVVQNKTLLELQNKIK